MMARTTDNRSYIETMSHFIISVQDSKKTYETQHGEHRHPQIQLCTFPNYHTVCQFSLSLQNEDYAGETSIIPIINDESSGIFYIHKTGEYLTQRSGVQAYLPWSFICEIRSSNRAKAENRDKPSGKEQSQLYTFMTVRILRKENMILHLCYNGINRDLSNVCLE